MAALGWSPGEHTQIGLWARALRVRRVDHDGVPIDARGRVFLPVGARAQLEIGADERLLLVAIPERALLIVHPLPMMAGLLADYCAHASGVLDDDA